RRTSRPRTRRANGPCCSSARREPCASRGRRSRCGGSASAAGRTAREPAGRRTMNVFLDLDGTLTNPEQGIVACIRHALDVLDRSVPANVDLTRYIGPPLADAFRELLATDDRAEIEAAVTAYRARFGTIGLFENELYDGIPEALEALTAR